VSRNNDKILLDCKAGCDTQQILTKLNLSESSLFLDDSPTVRIEASYQYHDVDGKLNFEVVRYAPKAFKQRRPDGKGGWLWNLQGVKRVLYHLPDIITAIAHGETIYVTEGEKDADSLWEWGLVATTNPMGTKKWKPEYTETLEGANIVLLPHNDSVGREHACMVIEALEGKVASPKVIELPKAKDVTEWLELGHTHDELMALVYETPYYNPNVNSLTYFNSKREDFTGRNENTIVSGQVSGQVRDKLSEDSFVYGELSREFDSFLEENREPHWKRDVAYLLGVDYRDESFRKLVYRRAKEGQIKICYGGDKIQWVNRDWKRSKIKLEAGGREYLNLVLPFGAEQLIATPEHLQIVVAGDVGSGKTHFGYLIADLNVGKIPIRHFVNEIGDQKAIRNLADFPKLEGFFDNGYDLINQDTENLDVAENLDHTGLNIYDYLHLPDSKTWYLWLQKELARLSQKIETGVIVIMLQKKRGNPMGYGADATRMQCEVYFSLHIDRDVAGEGTDYGYKECHTNIVKCKDWASNINPETMACGYKTAPKYGKLVPDIKGWIRKENFKT
jgi:hypothetical protein